MKNLLFDLEDLLVESINQNHEFLSSYMVNRNDKGWFDTDKMSLLNDICRKDYTRLLRQVYNAEYNHMPVAPHKGSIINERRKILSEETPTHVININSFYVHSVINLVNKNKIDFRTTHIKDFLSDLVQLRKNTSNELLKFYIKCLLNISYGLFRSARSSSLNCSNINLIGSELLDIIGDLPCTNRIKIIGYDIDTIYTRKLDETEMRVLKTVFNHHGFDYSYEDITTSELKRFYRQSEIQERRKKKY